MNIKALITFAIIGSSSVAMARPTFTASAEASWTYHNANRSIVRDHRHAPARYEEPQLFPSNNLLTEDASVYKGPYPVAQSARAFRSSYRAHAWVAITEPTRIDRGRQFVTDLPALGWFSTVRLRNVTGSTRIDTLLVRFKDGSEQVVKLGQTLNRWNATIDIRLDRTQKIHGFVVYGATSHGSAYQVLAL